MLSLHVWSHLLSTLQNHPSKNWSAFSSIYPLLHSNKYPEKNGNNSNSTYGLNIYQHYSVVCLLFFLILSSQPFGILLIPIRKLRHRRKFSSITQVWYNGNRCAYVAHLTTIKENNSLWYQWAGMSHMAGQCYFLIGRNNLSEYLHYPRSMRQWQSKVNTKTSSSFGLSIQTNSLLIMQMIEIPNISLSLILVHLYFNS